MALVGGRKLMKTYISRVLSLIILPVVLLSSVPVANALPVGQKGVYNEGINFFDLTYDNFCVSNPGGGTSGTGTITTDLASFVDTYGQAAFDIGKKNGIPYDAILAQASVESNNGQSELNKVANNFFGMKAGTSWTGPTVSMPTHEQDAYGNVFTVTAQFRSYPTPEAGFQGYVDFLRSFPRYATALQQRDPVAYFQALKNAGYATDVSYVDILTSRLRAVQAYIASKNLFPPSSQVVYDTPAPSPTDTTGGPAAANAACVGSTYGSATGIAAAALQELGNNLTKYTNGRTENWCADFVSWVYRAAGKSFVPTPGVPMVDGWQIPSVDGMSTYLETNGQFFLKSQTAPPPQPGDIVIYQNGMSHTNIVVEANGYMVRTVGGNQESTNVTQSVVSESKGAFDIRNESTVTGWGRLP